MRRGIECALRELGASRRARLRRNRQALVALARCRDSSAHTHTYPPTFCCPCPPNHCVVGLQRVRGMAKDSMFFLCLMYEMWWAPLDFAFTVIELPTAQRVVTNVVLSLFLVDILMNFNTGYVEGDLVIMRRRAIAWNYFAGWFWVDCLATVPDLIMAGVMSLDEQFSSVRVLRTMKFYKLLKALKLVRSVRLLRSQSMANKVLGHHNVSSTSVFLGQLLQGHVLLLVVIHFNAVLWAAYHPDWHDEASTTFDTVLLRYSESMARMYRSMTFGDDMLRGSPSQEAISVFVAIQRATALVMVTAWIIFRMLCLSATEASDKVAKDMRQGGESRERCGRVSRSGPSLEMGERKLRRS